MLGNTLAVDGNDLSSIRDELARLRALVRWRRQVLGVVGVGLLALGACAGVGVTRLWQQLGSCRAKLVESRQELSALAGADVDSRRASLEQPSDEPGAWSDHFTVTMYTARSAAYGKTNDGFTATMMKAEPHRRIVAVDPRLIPYHSKVWIEGLGWYNAEDCGGAIKGLKLDVMAPSYREAMQFGRQHRRVVIVPPGGGRA